ncbi:MAG: IS110 family transposase [Bacilli bacterium]|nr:IS110 family transposase [Bacilli bacterium]
MRSEAVSRSERKEGMKRPCVAVDVSKSKSHYQGWISIDKKCGNAKCIEHSKIGFQEISSKLKELEGITNEKPVVVFESTGVYHRSLRQYLEDNNIDYIMISPLASAKVRKSNIRSTKNDKRDCKTIARAYFEKDFPLHKKSDEIYDDLREMNRYYHYLTEQLKKCKVQFKLLSDIVFPKFDLYVKDYSEIPMTLFSKYHHPDEIRNKHPESLAKYLASKTCHHYSYCLKEAISIIRYCNECQSGCSKDSIDCVLFGEVIEQIKSKIEEQNSYLQKIIDLARDLPNYELLLTIPGISNNLAARILAEIGDISRFPRARSLVAYAGIDPNVYQSGENDGLHLRITKKGNKELRCLMYLAIQNTVQGNNVIADYYHKKNRDRPSKQSRESCMHE